MSAHIKTVLAYAIYVACIMPNIAMKYLMTDPEGNMAPDQWLANPGNPAMSPHAEGEKQAPITLIKQWKEVEGQGRGDSLQGVPMLRRNANAQKNAD